MVVYYFFRYFFSFFESFDENLRFDRGEGEWKGMGWSIMVFVYRYSCVICIYFIVWLYIFIIGNRVY